MTADRRVVEAFIVHLLLPPWVGFAYERQLPKHGSAIQSGKEKKQQ
jgi:hypothetical protein